MSCGFVSSMTDTPMPVAECAREVKDRAGAQFSLVGSSQNGGSIAISFSSVQRLAGPDMDLKTRA